MINLIPKNEKTIINRYFLYRLIAVYMVMLGMSILIAAVSISPPYILSITKLNSARAELKVQESEKSPIPDQQTLETIKSLSSKLKLIERTSTNKYVVSESVIDNIVQKMASGITITNISYTNDPTAGKSIDVKGSAPSRGALLEFKQSLENDPGFMQVDLPISSFVKDFDIEFSLSINPS